MIDLEAIKARTDAASAGPWRAGGGQSDNAYPVRARPSPAFGSYLEPVFHPGVEGDGGGSRADAEFCAHARTDIPALVAEIERLRASLSGSPTEPQPAKYA